VAGHVRELRNIIEGAVLLSEGLVLTLDALPREFLEMAQPAPQEAPPPRWRRRAACAASPKGKRR
jgi:DNA-binding NtrC family response regulator